MTVWIDMTTSYNWNRSAVGVVRLELEVVKEALNHNHIEYSGINKFGFFRYDNSTDEFIVLEKSEASQILSRIIYDDRSNEPDIKQECTLPTARYKVNPMFLKHEVKLFLRKCFHIFCSWLPYKYRPRAEWAARKLFGLMRKLVRLLSLKKAVFIDKKKRKCSVQRKSPFIKGDCLLSLGPVWDNPGITDRFHELKQDIGLSIYSIAFDLIPIIYPHLCLDFVAARFKKMYYDISWYSRHVFCISQNTLSDFCKFQDETGVNNVSKSTIVLGCDISEDKTSDPKIADFVQSAGDFVLYVSTIESRKNHNLLYNILCSWINDGLTDFPCFVFVGMYGWGIEDLKNLIIKDHRLKNKLHILDNVSDTGLVQLYKGSLFTVYPSLYEGWGLPITESLAHGRFCIASETSSMPEAGFGFTEHISPFDTKKWSDRILYYYENRDALMAREKLIKDKFEKPGWSQTVEEILRVVDETSQLQKI